MHQTVACGSYISEQTTTLPTLAIKSVRKLSQRLSSTPLKMHTLAKSLVVTGPWRNVGNMGVGLLTACLPM